MASRRGQRCTHLDCFMTLHHTGAKIEPSPQQRPESEPRLSICRTQNHQDQNRQSEERVDDGDDAEGNALFAKWPPQHSTIRCKGIE